MQSLGKYEIIEKIGTGGFGEVFKGHDPFIKRPVAIKTCASDDKEIRNRFFQEAEIAGNLHHRNITTVYDFGVQDGLPYLIQEYLSGEDLHHKVKRREPIPYPEKLLYLIQIARGLAYAHDNGVIHRDIKPSNIRILEDGTAKIMDFGIARLAQRESNLTKTGMTVGTAAYLAPEQIRGEAVSLPTDIFSFGVLSYELLTFERPFQGEQISAIMYSVLNSEPKPIRSLWPAAPQNIIALINRCLLKQAGQRFANGQELVEALEKIQRSGRAERLARSEEATHPMPHSLPTTPIRQQKAPPRLPRKQSPGQTQATDYSHTQPVPTAATEMTSVPAGTRPAVPSSDQTRLEGPRLDEFEFNTSTEHEPEIKSATSALDPIYVERRTGGGNGRTLAMIAALALVAALVGWWFGARQNRGGEAMDPTVDVVAQNPSAEETQAVDPTAGTAPQVDPPSTANPTTQPGTTQPGTTQPGTTQPGTTQPETTQPGTTPEALTQEPVAQPEVTPPPEPVPATVRFTKPAWTSDMRVRFRGRSLPLPTTQTVPAGTYDVTFEIEQLDYKDSRRIQIQLGEGQSRTIAPTVQEPGSLDIRPLPRRPQGTVLLDNQERGETPLRNLRLSPGDYPVEIRPRGESSGIGGMVTILSGRKTIVTFDLTAGSLTQVDKPLGNAPE